MVNIKINGLPYQVEEGMTILEAAKSVGINIPTLCYLKDINAIGACRICVVEVKGAKTLVTACVYPVNEGMEITTNSARVMDSRRRNLELLLSTHEKKCLSCVRSGNCELQALSKEFGVEDENHFAGEKPEYKIDDSAAQLYRDNNKCILCRRCVAVCRSWQGVSVIGPNNRGIKTHIGCAFDMDLDTVACVGCGQCVNVCPTGALSQKDPLREGVGRAQRSGQGGHCADRAGRPRRAGRVFRPAHGHRCGGKNWPPPCAGWALTRCSTPTSAPT